jgi:hypothetical protein
MGHYRLARPGSMLSRDSITLSLYIYMCVCLISKYVVFLDMICKQKVSNATLPRPTIHILECTNCMHHILAKMLMSPMVIVGKKCGSRTDLGHVWFAA